MDDVCAWFEQVQVQVSGWKVRGAGQVVTGQPHLQSRCVSTFCSPHTSTAPDTLAASTSYRTETVRLATAPGKHLQTKISCYTRNS